jgi:excinuclease ABC subunit A
LLEQLDTLVTAGHTVIVVEHEMRVVAQSDWVIDIGPGAGDQGGRIVAARRPPAPAPPPPPPPPPIRAAGLSLRARRRRLRRARRAGRRRFWLER